MFRRKRVFAAFSLAGIRQFMAELAYYRRDMRKPIFRHDVEAASFVLSLIFTCWAYLADPLVNPDGILYLRAAQAFASDGIQGALALFEWSFYPAAIGLLHQASGLPLIGAALLLNALLTGLLAAGFVCLCREAGGGRTTALFAAALLLAHPALNEYRNFVIRDFGFWAFGLWSLIALARYVARFRWRDALLWNGALLAAALFRSEALLLALAGPLALLVSGAPWRQRLGRYLKLNSILLALALLCAAWLLAYPEFWERLAGSAFYRQRAELFSGLIAEIGRAAQSLSDLILTQHSDEYGLLFLFAGLAAMLIAKLLSALGIAQVSLLLYGCWKLRPNLAPHCRWPWGLYLLASLIPLLAFLLFYRFLQGRHPMMLALLLMLPAPFFLEQLQRRAKQAGRQRLFAGAFALAMALCLIDGFVSFGHSKAYLANALQWVSAHTEAHERIQANSPTLAYHSGRPMDWEQVALFESQGAEALNLLTAPARYWLVELGQDDQTLASALDAKVRRGELQELARFANARGDRVIIYGRADGNG